LLSPASTFTSIVESSTREEACGRGAGRVQLHRQKKLLKETPRCCRHTPRLREACGGGGQRESRSYCRRRGRRPRGLGRSSRQQGDTEATVPGTATPMTGQGAPLPRSNVVGWAHTRGRDGEPRSDGALAQKEKGPLLSWVQSDVKEGEKSPPGTTTRNGQWLRVVLSRRESHAVKISTEAAHRTSAKREPPGVLEETVEALEKAKLARGARTSMRSGVTSKGNYHLDLNELSYLGRGGGWT